MTNDEYLRTQGQLALLAGLIQGLDLEAFLAQAARAEELGPFIDPTLWMKGHDRLAMIRELAKAALGFQRAAKKFAETFPKNAEPTDG